jgi:NADH:ubiquinone oxidoreductase subunit 6 (subunit J)
VILGAVVDWDALLDVVIASLVGAIGVTIVFSLGILGATRFAEVRRDEHFAGAIGYAVVAVAGLALTGLAVAVGLIEMLSK